MAGRTAPPDITQYVRHLMREAVRAGETRASLAKRLGLSGASVTQILDEGRGVGFRALDGVYRAFNLDSIALAQAAKEHAKAHPIEAPAPAERTRVEYPDRYPERAAAAEASRAMGLSRSAIDRVCGWELKGGESMSRWDWLEEFRSEARREARERINPDTVEEQRQHAIRSGQELLAREKELLAQREQLLRTPRSRKPPK